ncbi:MAG: Asp-tRNA(Asn)/Glu-tRNA(Gln) amidotransferase subunit GatA, partial [Rhizobiaceae bacterium]
MTDLTDLTIADARKGLDARDFTATELTGAYLNAIEARNGELNAYIAVTGDIAREQAAASDALIAKGGAGGPTRSLEGIP